MISLMLLSVSTFCTDDSRKLFQGIDFWDVCRVIGMVALMFLAVYCLLSYLCEKNIREEVTERRKG